MILVVESKTQSEYEGRVGSTPPSYGFRLDGEGADSLVVGTRYELVLIEEEADDD